MPHDITTSGLVFLFAALYVVSVFVTIRVLDWYYKRVVQKAVDEIHRQYAARCRHCPFGKS